LIKPKPCWRNDVVSVGAFLAGISRREGGHTLIATAMKPELDACFEDVAPEFWAEDGGAHWVFTEPNTGCSACVIRGDYSRNWEGFAPDGSQHVLPVGLSEEEAKAWCVTQVNSAVKAGLTLLVD